MVSRQNLMLTAITALTSSIWSMSFHLEPSMAVIRNQSKLTMPLSRGDLSFKHRQTIPTVSLSQLFSAGTYSGWSIGPFARFGLSSLRTKPGVWANSSRRVTQTHEVAHSKINSIRDLGLQAHQTLNTTWDIVFKLSQHRYNQTINVANYSEKFSMHGLSAGAGVSVHVYPRLMTHALLSYQECKDHKTHPGSINSTYALKSHGSSVNMGLSYQIIALG